MFQCTSLASLAITHALSIHHNRLINDRLSVNQTLPQLIIISHRMLTDPLALPRFFNQQGDMAEVKYVKRPHVWCYDEDWRLATKHDGCAYNDVLAAVLLKLKLVLCFRLYEEYKKRLWEEIYWGICLPKIIKTDLGLTKYCKNTLVQFFWLTCYSSNPVFNTSCKRTTWYQLRLYASCLL